MAVIKYNGTEITCPSVQEYEGQQLVDSGRNANGVVVAQKINRRQVKLTLEWKVIYKGIAEDFAAGRNFHRRSDLL